MFEEQDEKKEETVDNRMTNWTKKRFLDDDEESDVKRQRVEEVTINAAFHGETPPMYFADSFPGPAQVTGLPDGLPTEIANSDDSVVRMPGMPGADNMYPLEVSGDMHDNARMPYTYTIISSGDEQTRAVKHMIRMLTFVLPREGELYRDGLVQSVGKQPVFQLQSLGSLPWVNFELATDKYSRLIKHVNDFPKYFSFIGECCVCVLLMFIA